ncbi:MAG: type II toxin-antitoxin system CcdA family antitoxin [Burkholderiaceae bacterium]
MEAAFRSKSPRKGTAAKRPTNLSLSSDVLDEARRLEINISEVCDAHLRELILRAQQRKWREDHAEFVAAYNATIASEGLPLDEWKSF